MPESPENPGESTDPPDPRGDELVILAFAHHPIAAHLIRSNLESSGIGAVVEGEHGAAMVVMISNTSTSILVARRDYARAVEVLAELQAQSPHEHDRPAACPVCQYDLSGLDSSICPECGGDVQTWHRLRKSFAMAPPPDSASPIQRAGVAIGLGLLILAAAFVFMLVLTQVFDR